MGEPYYEDDFVTIYHGDCREIMPDLEYDCILADPPYGVGYVARQHGRAKCANVGVEICGDSATLDPAPMLTSPAILWGGNNYTLPRGGWLVWDKCRSSGLSMATVELAWTNTSEKVRVFRHLWDGYWRASERGVHLHPTMKPVALMSWCVGFLPDGVILDPYMGSGPVLRAAKDLGRKAIGIEIEERYCEIAANRMRQEVLAL